MPQPSKKNDAPQTENLFDLWMHEDRDEDRGLKISLGAAIVLHAVLLLITFPQVYTDELEPPPEPKVVHLVPTPRFKPPVVEPERQRPKEKVTRVPVPAPDPDAPEPLMQDVMEPDLPDLPELDMTGLAIPDSPPPPPDTGPLRVGGEVAAPDRVHYVPPVYTEIARRARIQGVAILQATINTRGDVVEVKVLKGLPMGLTESALQAVQQWKYAPATLRGKPVAVYLNLTVHFNLQ
jgi:TonB family protein